MMIDFNKAPLQKEFVLEQDRLYTVKEVSKMTGVALKRIYDLVESGIITPCNTVQKGDGVRNFTYYDSVNILEIYLVGRLSVAGIPKRTIKDFFVSISSMRESLNPFKIDEHDENAFLVFTHGIDSKVNFMFLSGSKDKSYLQELEGTSVSTLINLSGLVVELLNKIDSL